ncbi:MAG: signal recognition particle protein Srp19, partial [Candidatus Nanoarchaeia archaeon]
ALSEKSAKTLTAREHTINIVYDELVKFLGAEEGKLLVTEKPTKILLVGLFGSGKTTTAAKLAKFLKKQGLKCCLVQTDTWRPAAYEQLKQLSEKINVPFYGIKEEKDPVKIIEKFRPDFDRFNVVIFDSAGRDALNKELIEEIKKVKNAIKPHESLLVISGDIGQGAQAQAQAFKDAVAITGVIVTKLDGTAKGGGALTACSATSAKVKFIGLGEHIDDFEEYKPKNFVSRLLGMGDIESLLKKAEDAMQKEEAEALAKKMLKAEFTFDDLMKQMEALQKMGPLSQIMSMIPGMGMAKIPEELLHVQEGKMKSWKHIIQSMTKHERDNPDLIDAKRIQRIAKGSGKPESDVRELIKQYNQMKKMMKLMGNQKQMQKLQKMLGGKIPRGLGF